MFDRAQDPLKDYLAARLAATQPQAPAAPARWQRRLHWLRHRGG